MKKILAAFRALCFTSILLLSACIEFTNTIVDHPLPNDPRVLGVWEGPNGKHAGYLLISEKTTSELLISSEDKDGPCKKPEILTGVRTVMTGRNFVEISSVDSEKVKGEEKRLPFPLAYKINRDGRLTLYAPDPRAIARDVKSGALPGAIVTEKAGRGRYPTGTVTATTAELREYFGTHPRSMRVWLRLSPRPDLHRLPACRVVSH